MKLVSWNVNGIRSALRKGLQSYVSMENPDVLCLQEVRALPQEVEMDLPGYQLFWNPATRKGYSGTAIFSRTPLESISRGLPAFLDDDEGRVITAVHKDFYLVNVYTPNARRDL
ncbi:MAG: exodeoxyribonuclease III, partial [Deltaproteobacteria bacterium]|nr:exodeoxyribonuclease III [Deltaproteobacteria bacterium]